MVMQATGNRLHSVSAENRQLLAMETSAGFAGMLREMMGKHVAFKGKCMFSARLETSEFAGVNVYPISCYDACY